MLGAGLIDGAPAPRVLTGGTLFILPESRGGEAPETLELVFADWTLLEPLIAERIEALANTGSRASAGTEKGSEENISFGS